MLNGSYGSACFMNKVCFVIAVLLCSTACTKEDISTDLRHYKAAISTVGLDPQVAVDTCGNIENTAIRSDCFGAVGQMVVVHAPDLAEKACKQTHDGVDRYECYFRLAEETGRVDLCQLSGPFARPCSHHIWSGVLPVLLWGENWAERPEATRRMLTPVGTFEAGLERELISLGLDPADESFWELAYRAVFLQQCPVDVRECVANAPGRLKKACVRGARRAIDSKEVRLSGSSRVCTTMLGAELGEQLLMGR